MPWVFAVVMFPVILLDIFIFDLVYYEGGGNKWRFVFSLFLGSFYYKYRLETNWTSQGRLDEVYFEVTVCVGLRVHSRKCYLKLVLWVFDQEQQGYCSK